MVKKLFPGVVLTFITLCLGCANQPTEIGLDEKSAFSSSTESETVSFNSVYANEKPLYENDEGDESILAPKWLLDEQRLSPFVVLPVSVNDSLLSLLNRAERELNKHLVIDDRALFSEAYLKSESDIVMLIHPDGLVESIYQVLDNGEVSPAFISKNSSFLPKRADTLIKSVIISPATDPSVLSLDEALAIKNLAKIIKDSNYYSGKLKNFLHAAVYTLDYKVILNHKGQILKPPSVVGFSANLRNKELTGAFYQEK